MKYFISAIIIVLFLFHSCTPPDYIKSSPNIPLFDTVNQLNTTIKFGSLIEYQGSYSITNTFGVFGGFNLGNIIHENRNYYYEGGISLTKQSKVDFINLCIGSSFGNRNRSWKLGLYPKFDILDIDINYYSFFVQPSVGFINSKKGRKTLLSLKIDRLYYKNYKYINYEYDESGYETYNYFTDIDTKNIDAIRIGLFLTTQKSRKGFDSFFQFGYSFPLIYSIEDINKGMPINKGLLLKFGINIPIVGRKKSNKKIYNDGLKTFF